MKTFFLVYKRLIAPGGAERLLLNEYINLKALGYNVKIITFEYVKESSFNVRIDGKDLVILGSNWYVAMVKFYFLIRKHKKASFLCSSGHIEMYLLSLLIKYKYSLHIHHPSYMSFNETDKFSIFQIKHFESMLKSNYGASRFRQIYENLTILQKIYINLRAFISIKAIQASKNNFVLSNYAKREKKILFGVDSKVVCGALDNEVFNFEVNKIDSKYLNYKYRILSVGRLDANKRIDELILAFKNLREENVDAALLIGGAGPQLDFLKAKVKNYSLDDHVYFLGFIDEKSLYDYYSAIDLFVSIDWADFRITSYEALAMGAKVILSNETEPDQFLLDSNYLFLTDPNHSETVKMIKEALDTKPNISKAQLDKYLEQFKWINFSKKIAENINYND